MQLRFCPKRKNTLRIWCRFPSRSLVCRRFHSTAVRNEPWVPAERGSQEEPGQHQYGLRAVQEDHWRDSFPQKEIADCIIDDGESETEQPAAGSKNAVDHSQYS